MTKCKVSKQISFTHSVYQAGNLLLSFFLHNDSLGVQFVTDFNSLSKIRKKKVGKVHLFFEMRLLLQEEKREMKRTRETMKKRRRTPRKSWCGFSLIASDDQSKEKVGGDELLSLSLSLSLFLSSLMNWSTTATNDSCEGSRWDPSFSSLGVSGLVIYSLDARRLKGLEMKGRETVSEEGESSLWKRKLKHKFQTVCPHCLWRQKEASILILSPSDNDSIMEQCV